MILDELERKIKKLFAQYGYNELVEQLLLLFPQWVGVNDRLPEKDGEYYCMQYKAPGYGPRLVHFNATYDEGEFHEEAYWDDRLPHINGGGGAVKPYNLMTDKEKYFMDNYMKVTHWYPLPTEIED